MFILTRQISFIRTSFTVDAIHIASVVKVYFCEVDVYKNQTHSFL
jgi:hypothetical protein